MQFFYFPFDGSLDAQAPTTVAVMRAVPTVVVGGGIGENAFSPGAVRDAFRKLGVGSRMILG